MKYAKASSSCWWTSHGDQPQIFHWGITSSKYNRLTLTARLFCRESKLKQEKKTHCNAYCANGSDLLMFSATSRIKPQHHLGQEVKLNIPLTIIHFRVLFFSSEIAFGCRLCQEKLPSCFSWFTLSVTLRWQTRFQSPRYPCLAERETKTSGIFLGSVYLFFN